MVDFADKPLIRGLSTDDVAPYINANMPFVPVATEQIGDRLLWQKLFDREIQAGELKGYVPAPNRVDYEEDFEVVAFEEELRGRGIALA